MLERLQHRLILRERLQCPRSDICQERGTSWLVMVPNAVLGGGQPSSAAERAGHSTYPALILKVDKRYAAGLTLLGSHVISKMFSDTDTAAVSSLGTVDHYNRRLEKGLSGSDQTHVFRVAFSYDLPVGKGKRWALGRGRWPK